MAAVAALIEQATNSTAPDVDHRLLKAIKSAVRSSDSEVRDAAQTLLSLMKRNHSQVRYLSLLIIHELFMRSKLFRHLIVENLDQLLSLSVGFRRNVPLPAPASIASILRSKAIEFLEKWNLSFGVHYRKLRLGYDYLKNTLRFQFPNLQANAARIQQERRDRELKTKEILLKKFEHLKVNLVYIKEEMMSTIDEVGECLSILRTRNEDVPLAPIDAEEMEEFRNSELRQLRHDAMQEGENVQENSENKVIFDALRELYKVLVTKHLPAIQEWISVLIRADIEDYRFRDSTMKDFIDIRNVIQITKRKCEESGCTLSTNADTEEDFWEHGTLQTNDITDSGPNDYPASSTANDSIESECTNEQSNRCTSNNCETSGSKSNPLRDKLLAEAPVYKSGSFLDNWGSNHDVYANHRGLDIEGHWGRVEQDAVIPAKKITELNMQVSVYEEKLVDIQPCRAPLKNGQLCQRRDLRVCPFHGRIICRDDEGKPINDVVVKENESETNEEGIIQNVNSDAVEEYLKQAVKNVRERDRKEGRKRQSDKLILKKAKLAKVREHNDNVLRNAAIASTSRSSHIEEDSEIRHGTTNRSKRKKQTLASMLKQKESTKDRLSQRLLNNYATSNAVKQLTEAEHANYRESFPNQW